MTPEESAAQRAAAVIAERDAVQANLLELDGGFAKQVLEGAALSGQTRDRWAAASASLATLWETFLAYSAAIDRVAALGTGTSGPPARTSPSWRTCSPGAASSCRAPRCRSPAATWPRLAARRLPSPPPSAPCAGVHRGNRADRGRRVRLGGHRAAVRRGHRRPGPRRPLAAGLGPGAQAELRDAVTALAALRAAPTRTRWPCGARPPPGPGPAGGRHRVHGHGRRRRAARADGGARRPRRRARPAATAGPWPDRRAHGGRDRRPGGPAGGHRGLAGAATRVSALPPPPPASPSRRSRAWTRWPPTASGPGWRPSSTAAKPT